MSNTTMKQLNFFLNENKKDIKTLTSNLGISILIVIVLIEFFNRITNNFSLILKNYVDENRLIYGSEKTDKLDNYNYNNDEDFNYKKTQILKSIRHIRINNENNFEDIVNYKKKYNLDSDINSKIDRKVLNGDNDNYEYKNQPNFIDFILDIFKPTKA
tara:strand:+ start:184 stop:657 length:474 start_codon:yes stop_codon:yes gene_type:complete